MNNCNTHPTFGMENRCKKCANDCKKNALKLLLLHQNAIFLQCNKYHTI